MDLAEILMGLLVCMDLQKCSHEDLDFNNKSLSIMLLKPTIIKEKAMEITKKLN